jgi:hypothetical protein
MTTISDDGLEQILRIFFGLLDLSRDLERNDDDAQFRSEGGVIHYLLDADLLEVFVQPWDTRGRSASLHRSAWLTSDHSHSPAWNAIASQTALSATEYLVSGTLPAQRDHRILMTLEHRFELARRAEAMAAEYAQALAAATPESNVKRFQQAARIRECVATPGDNWRDILRFDSVLYEDLLKLKAKGTDGLASFAGTRATIKALVSDRQLEPAEQVERIVGPVLRQRFATLHQVFPVRYDEQKAVSADTARWFDLLKAEAKLQGVLIADKSDGAGSERGRSKPALWDDARSLATARWVALRRLDSKARLVFVTADELLFDTYRRWYANLTPSDLAYSEPFILRRLVQFAPMFNLSDSGKLHGDAARQVFQDMRHLLEINLLTLNLSRLSARSPAESILTRMRELTALRQRNPASIAKDPLYRALASALREKAERGELKEIGVILDSLRELERLSLGQVDDHVRARLTERQARILRFGERESGDHAMLRYVGDLVHKMLAVSVKIWLPLARDFINAWKPRQGKELIRAPIAIRLKVSVDGRPIDVGDALYARLYQERGSAPDPLFTGKAWDQLESDEALVFAIAAVLALASDDWGNAVHFSERAQKTQRARQKNDERLAEYEYLAALAKRFRIGSQGVPKSADALNRLVRTYRAALESLDWCVTYHEAGEEGETHVVRLLRSVSERAALRLFFASVLMPAVGGAADHSDSGAAGPVQGLSPKDYMDILEGERLSVAKDCVISAEADLNRCLMIDLPLEVDAEDRKRALWTVRRQYLVNICSAAVARHLLQMPKAEYVISNDELKVRVRTFLRENESKAYPLMRAEMLGYLGLSGDRWALDEIKKLRDAGFPPDAMILDKALFAAIVRESANGFGQ